MSYRGDIRLGDTIDIKFTTRRFSSGAPFTLAGSPAVSAYVDNGTTEITAGITLTVDFDSRTGLNNVRVVASGGNGFAAGTNVDLVITAGTVDSVSVVGEVIGSFSIEKRSALMPTTAGRTLDVAATGEAGLDFNNILSTSLITLHSLTVTNATTLSGAVSFGSTFTITGATSLAAFSCTTLTASGAVSFQSTFGVSGTMTVNAFTCTNNFTVSGNWLTTGTTTWTGAATFTGNLTSNITGNLSGSVGSVTGNVGGNVAGSVGSVTGNVGGNVAGSVGAVVGSVGGNLLGSAGSLAAQAQADVRTAVGLAAADLDTQIGTLATAAALAAVAADLPNRITKNTALSGFTFLMIDSSDHVTGKTGLTVTATRSIDGGAFAACTNAVSEVSNGIYKIDLSAADLNGNVITLKFTATGADARFITIATQPT